jgi:hypothetical protein
LQDDTQRPEQGPPPAPTPGPPASPQPSQPAAPSPQPNESTVTPRGLEQLRGESTGTTSGLSALGLTSEHEEHPFHAGLDTSLTYGYEHQEPMYLPLALSVGAGFKFGCGFILAVGVAVFAMFLLLSVLFFVAALAGVTLPGAPGQPL